MTNRTALSARLRFEVFKRDGFRCVYCGASPVESVLHVDHVKPVAEGGDNDPTNLVTACQACNGGKSSVPLGTKRLGPTRTPEEAQDHADQILAYLAAEKSVVEAKSAVADGICEVWEREVGWTVTPRERSFLCTSVERYGMSNLVDAIRLAVSRIGPRTDYQATQCFKYLCGIVRRWRETGDVTLGGTKRYFGAEQNESDDARAVSGLLSWLGFSDMDHMTCEMCCKRGAACGDCNFMRGDCHTCRVDSEVKIYRIIRDSKKVPPSSSNLIVLCPSCLRANQGPLGFASELYNPKYPHRTARRIFFEDASCVASYHATLESQAFDREMEAQALADLPAESGAF